MTTPRAIVVVFDQDEAEELAALLTMYTDLDPDPEIQAILKKLTAAIIEDVTANEDVEEPVH